MSTTCFVQLPTAENTHNVGTSEAVHLWIGQIYVPVLFSIEFGKRKKKANSLNSVALLTIEHFIPDLASLLLPD